MITNPVWRQLAPALRLSLSAVCALYISLSIGLDKPYWATVTVLIIEGSFLGIVQQRIHDRLWGTLMGVTLGVATLIIAGDMRPVLITFCFVIISLTTYLSLEYRRFLLMWRWTALTCLLVVVIGLSTNFYFMTGLSRIWGILIGIGTALVFHILFFPITSNIGIQLTLKKIVALLRQVLDQHNDTNKVTVLSEFYIEMENMHQLLRAHAIEKYHSRVHARGALQLLEALEKLGEQIILQVNHTQMKSSEQYYRQLVELLDKIDPLSPDCFPDLGKQFEQYANASKEIIPAPLKRSIIHLSQSLSSVDMSTIKKTEFRGDSEPNVYFSDSWYDNTFYNAYKALVIGAGSAFALWLWSELAWPGGLFMVVLAMLIGQFTALEHGFKLKAIIVLLILNLLITSVNLIFILPVIDSSSGFFLWLFIFHLFFCWFVFSSNAALGKASLILLVMSNLLIHSYQPTPYAMQVILTYTWGVTGALLIGTIIAFLLKPRSPLDLLKNQYTAFFKEYSALHQTSETNKAASEHCFRKRIRMATVWWRALPDTAMQARESSLILDMLEQQSRG